jgi:hypothetical protein
LGSAANNADSEALRLFSIRIYPVRFHLCRFAAAIASTPFLGQGMFVTNWLKSWVIAWIIMTPFVLLAAPLINRAVAALTRGDE